MWNFNSNLGIFESKKKFQQEISENQTKVTKTSNFRQFEFGKFYSRPYVIGHPVKMHIILITNSIRTFMTRTVFN